MLTAARPPLLAADSRPEPRLLGVGGWLSRLASDDVMTLATALFVGAACVACLTPAQNDTWFHLRAGRDIWSGTSVYVDHYSYTVAGREWVNREWLSQLLFFLVYSAGGMRLLTALIATVACVSLALLWATLDGPPLKRLVLTAITFPALVSQWSLRPEMLSLLCVAVLLWLLKRRTYTWIPPLVLVWANLHGGVVIGLAVIGATSGVIFLDRPAERRKGVVVALACIAAAFCTPLGVRLWTTMPGAISQMRRIGVTEFQPPTLTDPAVLPFWILLGAFVALCVVSPPWRQDGRASRPIVAAALVTVAGGLTSTRNTVVASFVLAQAVDMLSARWDGGFDRRHAAPHRVLNVSLIAGALMASISVVAIAWSRPATRLGWQPMSAGAIRAVNACAGNLYDRFDDGGYLVWFTPSRKVFIDSRYDPFGASFVAEHREVENSGRYEPVFARYHITCAFLPPESPVAQRLVANGWSSMYADDNWMVLRSTVSVTSSNSGG